LSVRYQVEAGSEEYTVVDAATTVYWAVITGLATDEIYGDLNAPGFAIVLARKDMKTKALSNGTYAICTYMAQSFPLFPGVGATVDYTLTAPGFRDLAVSTAIAANADLPAVAISPSAMRRLPVRIQGRVVHNTVTRPPIAGALITSVDNAALPATHVTALRCPLSFAHTSGAVQEVAIASLGGTTLTQRVVGGDTVLNLNDRTGFTPGAIVRLTSPGESCVEYGVIGHLGPGAANTPGQVYLQQPLRQSYPTTGTAVDCVTATPTGASGTLSADADAGDGVLLASQLFKQTISIDSGGPAAEIHEVGAMSDSNGYYRLDGIGRVATISLQVTQGALQQTTEWFLEYDQAVNQLDFRL
jgi:hypothetical protein